MLERVGKYKIKHELGRGTSSAVYLAYDEFADVEVALKIYESESAVRDARVFKGQFMSEAALAGKLHHPHIVAILDAVVDEHYTYVAMEYVHGGNLSRYTSVERLLPVADVIEMAFKCCGALDYAYRHGVVHRDIKPANILVARGTEVKLADFGAAFLRDLETTQRVRVGSPSYIAPEQIRDDPLTHQSDMFSLGVCLYELLVGRRPFTADKLEALIEKITSAEPRPPSELRPTLPRELDAVVLRALRKDPAHRYGTWAQFAVELSKVIGLVQPPSLVADSEKYLALSKVEMLQLLGDAEFWELAGAARWTRRDKGSTILRENASGTSFYFLAKGEVKVTKKGRLLSMIHEGECFGEMAFIRGGEEPREATVEAATDVVVAEFQPETLEGLSHSAQLHLTRALVRNAVERLALANSRLAR